MNLTIEDLKTIRLALSNHPLTRAVNTAIEHVDAELAAHNIKAVYKSKPKRPYQRRAEGEYIFEPINK